MGVHATDKYFHCDTTHPGFNALRGLAQTRHTDNAPGTVLSVTPNVAGTEAIVKVRGGAGLASPAVIRTYTQADHADIFAFLYTPAWTAPNA